MPRPTLWAKPSAIGTASKTPERPFGGNATLWGPPKDPSQSGNTGVDNFTNGKQADAKEHTHIMEGTPADDIKPQMLPDVPLDGKIRDMVLVEHPTPKYDTSLEPTDNNNDATMAAAGPMFVQQPGSTLERDTIHHSDTDEDSLFVRDRHERSTTTRDGTDTVIKKEEGDGEPTPIKAVAINPQQARDRPETYNNADDDDNDKTGLYAPPMDFEQSNADETYNNEDESLGASDLRELLGDYPTDALSASKEEPAPVASRARAKATRAKTAREWHARENQKKAPAKKRKRAILHREPTGPNKRYKKDQLTVVDEQGSQPRSDKKALQQAIGNLLYSHPMHARMGRDPSAEHRFENESTTTISKKACLQQAISEASCDAETAMKDWRILEKAAQSFGSNKCKPTEGRMWMLDGIRLPLYHHQMLGISWMVDRECDDWYNGGINADEMGLGKTIQALGTIVSNPPQPRHIKNGKKTTLIVAPSSIVRQWKSEIDLFLETNHRGSVHIFKLSDDKSLLDLNFFDIIVTSYNEVMRGHPSEKATLKRYNQKYSPRERVEHKEERKKQLLQELHEQHESPLFKMNFWRVILDEAHTIKDPSSQTSIACRALKAKYRWAMTGTPMQNNLTEMWPYLSFLHVSWEKGQKKFGQLVSNIDQPGNKQQFQTILEEIVQKRTSESRIFGNPPFVIPHCFVEKEIVSLSPEETVIYKFLEKKYKEATKENREEFYHGVLFDDVSQPKSKNKSRQEKKSGLDNVTTIILRMRQTTVHPYLLESTISNELSKEDIQELRNGLAKLKNQSAVGDVVSSLSSTTAGLSMDERLGVAFALKGCTICSFCGCEASNPRAADCTHTFCRECLDAAMVTTAVSAESNLKCPECRKPIAGLQDVENDTTCDEDKADTESTVSLPAALGDCDPDELADFLRFREMRKSAKAPKSGIALGKDGKKLGNDFFNLQVGGKKYRSKYFENADKQYPTEFPPSSKTTAIVEAVVKWQKEAPDDKILIFTQFVAENQILGRLLQRKGIKFAYVFGEMPKKARERAIDGFNTEAELKVLIISLQVGGVGLNLTCANRVILADPWWNVAIEAQAWCRVFRIGQRKKTHFLTVLMKATIDVRIADLQDAKIKKIQAMLDKGESSSVEEYEELINRAPTAEELKALMAPAHEG